MIYFDHAATSLPRQEGALLRASEAAAFGNPRRGRHGLQAKANAALDQARAAIRKLVGFGEAAFLSSATHSLNQAILGWTPRPLAVAVDPMAHNSVRRPALRLGVPVWTLPHDENGRIDLEKLDETWEQGTGLVVLTHGSNISGLLQPVAEVAAFAQSRGAAVIVDAAQTAGIVFPMELGPVDAVALSGHKGLRALPGTGALVATPGCDIDPLITGGIGWDDTEEDMPEEYPYRLEAGTSNLPGAVAMGVAAEHSMSADWDWRSTATRLEDAVRKAGVTKIWSGELPVLSFIIEGLSPTEVEQRLDADFEIVVRSGLHCSPEAHQVLNTLTTGTVRVSASSSTGEDDFNALTTALASLIAN
ncbi:MAG: aminotransferase class V-fold PLP-dependent enzyme [Myxococcota bacterium]